MKLQCDKQTLGITNLCRISSTLSGRKTYLLAQCDSLKGKSKSLSIHRKEIFKQIKDYLTQNNSINNVTVSSNFNQDIASNEMQ